MFKQLLISAAVAATMTLQAATLSIVPGMQTIAVGETATVDIQVGGLTANQALGAFDLTVLNNSSSISAINLLFMGALGDPGLQLTGSSLSAGSVNGAETSLESTATLFGLQPTQPFSIFRVTYQGLIPGMSMLSFATSGQILSDGRGAIVPITSMGTSSITVTGAGMPGVPEPSSIFLLSGGMAVLLLVFRSRRQAHN